jgi:hypothetical protein
MFEANGARRARSIGSVVAKLDHDTVFLARKNADAWKVGAENKILNTDAWIASGVHVALEELFAVNSLETDKHVHVVGRVIARGWIKVHAVVNLGEETPLRLGPIVLGDANGTLWDIR